MSDFPSSSFNVLTAASRLLCASCVIALGACGGGGGNDTVVPASTTPISSGTGTTGGTTVPIVTNTAPIAAAGLPQNVIAGATVTLDGSASTDANADRLTYSWVLTARPAGSLAVLNDPTAVRPTFVADIAGAYAATIVVNDGKVSSSAANVAVTASVANVAPIANPGLVQNVISGATVTLDGSGSSDANNDNLTYAWSLTAKPAGSTAVIGIPTAVRPTFTADVVGTYVASLTVSDGQAPSAPATVSVIAALGAVAPVANAGAAQNVNTASTVTLDGRTSSDANGDALTYAWSLTSLPTGSKASLSAANTARPTFQPDVAGMYIASLVVNDGKLSSAPATVVLTATVVNAAPVAAAGSAQTIGRGDTATLNGSNSSDANGDPLAYTWSITSKPANSTAVLSGTTTASPTFVADRAGDYVARLVVNDGKVDSTASNVTITAADIQLFEPSTFSGESAATLSYSGVSNLDSIATCLGSGCPTDTQVDKFRLQAIGRAYTITNVQAVNLSAGTTVIPTFGGLTNDQVIGIGQSVPFTLRSSFTGGRTVMLNYSFTVKETAQTFNYRVTLRTN